MVVLCVLPLEDNGHVFFFKYLLSLRPNIIIKTMYVEQKMYFEAGEILEKILMQRNMNEEEHVWVLGSKSFRILNIFGMSDENFHCCFNE